MVNTQIRSLTSADYYQMMESGIIREGERVELILGQIFTMAAKGTRHTVATSRLLKSLLMLIGEQAIVRCQDPISLPNHSEPEPDIVIARLRLDDYINSHPSPADIILVIEVADSSIKFDRETKGLMARSFKHDRTGYVFHNRALMINNFPISSTSPPNSRSPRHALLLN